MLFQLGVRGQSELDQAADAEGLEVATAALIRRVPALGDRIAEQLEQRDREVLATKIRTFAERCRAASEEKSLQECAMTASLTVDAGGHSVSTC